MIDPMQKASNEIRKLLGVDLPLEVEIDRYSGKLTAIRYDKSWKTGGTEPVFNDSGVVVDFEENYEHHALTEEQIKTLDAHIKSLLSEAA